MKLATARRRPCGARDGDQARQDRSRHLRALRLGQRDGDSRRSAPVRLTSCEFAGAIARPRSLLAPNRRVRVLRVGACQHRALLLFAEAPAEVGEVIVATARRGPVGVLSTESPLFEIRCVQLVEARYGRK